MMQKKKEYKALSLFSGGLDSMLSVKVIQQQGIKVIPVCFVSPFFSAKRAVESGKQLGIFVNVIELDEEYLNMVKDPKHGYGKYMNPCIDCHAFMYKKIGDMMEKFKADFLISGEVLGQRPMSQQLNGMNAVAKRSGYKDLIVRPLSQKLLPDTKPLREGWVDKELLLDLHGRGRTQQIELAKKLGIIDYPTPAGGCLLTDPGYSKRLRDLIDHDMFDLEFITFLNVGRHFRLDNSTKLILGRNQNNNEYIIKLNEKKEIRNIIISAKDIPGPIGVVQSRSEKIPDELLQLSAEILVRYLSKVKDKAVVSIQFPDGKVKEIAAKKHTDGFERELLIH